MANVDAEGREECPICFEALPLVVLEVCKHPVCWSCCSRLTKRSGSTQCPLCKQFSGIELDAGRFAEYASAVNPVLITELGKVSRRITRRWLWQVLQSFLRSIGTISSWYELSRWNQITREPTYQLAFEIAYDEWRQSSTVCLPDPYRRCTVGVVPEVATPSLSKYRAAGYRVCCLGIDLIASTCETATGHKLNAIQYLVYNEYIAAGSPGVVLAKFILKYGKIVPIAVLSLEGLDMDTPADLTVKYREVEMRKSPAEIQSMMKIVAPIEARRLVKDVRGSCRGVSYESVDWNTFHAPRDSIIRYAERMGLRRLSNGKMVYVKPTIPQLLAGV